ncbi:MAG: DUF503 domain-containing protein, partial [Heliobacteriaceae bacterium]|nr:DUF503 domain-containing protein [Heliobacteriaceae bacterium]
GRTMAVGYSEVSLHIPGILSLKEKRRVIKSLTERLRGKFNLSVAEVAGHDLWQVAVIGLAVVSNDRTHIRRVLAAAIRQMEGTGDVEVTEVTTEVY